VVDYRLELVIIPVADTDVSRAFYGDRLGWPVDHDQVVNEALRFVQVTPPGSACSIAFGTGIGDMTPGSMRALQVVVGDIEEAHADLSGRGVDVSAIDDQPWGRFVRFADPDGNTWAVQQIPDYGS
jgi:catechol 2,3-dioxygenase-like lactoylglutathione lyase family enzyme